MVEKSTGFPEKKELHLINLAEQTDDPAYMLALTDFYLTEQYQPQQLWYWLDRLLAKDYLPAYLVQAQLYLSGNTVEQDLDKAAGLFEQLVERYSQSENIETSLHQLAFSHLSLARISHTRHHTAPMLMHYFYALQFDSVDAAEDLATMFTPNMAENPQQMEYLAILQCVFLTLSAVFLQQQSDDSDDEQQQQRLLQHYAEKKNQILENITRYQLTSSQRDEIRQRVRLWNEGEHQHLMEDVVSYINS
ncbi:hypothetical protein I2494_08515 [Budviciaceae bacterium BWR-B9]|uniref:Tetratricopeptide repeat protein n=1 Tax=Limnobaculum allomyrinae TaxID=2791986 RepID=A0ABS1IPU5_9GAMM|nr:MULTISPECIES: hypothetical protein [Limnobaculum]MBK5143758.1 hypothetical protein [Limnobaculum allomyrinae]MBV7693497.1 hypothetical protein [Limnobaculum sp. M2-1]